MPSNKYRIQIGRPWGRSKRALSISRNKEGVRAELYATIKQYESSERVRRQDFKFDAFRFISSQIEGMTENTLRLRCRAPVSSHPTRLALQEAIEIMKITADYRLLRYTCSELGIPIPHQNKFSILLSRILPRLRLP